jgi:hypothetical protein
MPSSPNYKRNYAEEAKTAKARGELGGSDAPNAERQRDRRKALKLGMIKPSQTLDHKKPLSKGGAAGKPSNWRGESAHDNYSYPRNKDGSMKKNEPNT